MATMTQVQAKILGTVLTATAATAGPDKVLPGDSGGKVYVIAQNGGASSITVTVADPGKTKYQQQNPSLTSASIAAGGFAIFGPVESDLKQSDGYVNFTASATASVNWFAFRG